MEYCEKKRCFIALSMPNEIKLKIKNIQEKLPDFYGKKTEIKNLHLTLKFLGEIDSCKIGKVREKLREIKLSKFDVKIFEIGVFSEKFVRIIWLGIKGGEFLQKNIDDKIKEIGFPLENRFMSHLTIGRVKSVKNKKEFLDELYGLKIPEDFKFKVNEFCLIKSVLKKTGPEYSVIEKFELI